MNKYFRAQWFYFKWKSFTWKIFNNPKVRKIFNNPEGNKAIYFGQRLTFEHHKVMQSSQWGVWGAYYKRQYWSLGVQLLQKKKTFEHLIHLVPIILHHFWLLLSLHCDCVYVKTQRYIRYSHWYLYKFSFLEFWVHKPCVPEIGLSTSILACITHCWPRALVKT